MEACSRKFQRFHACMMHVCLNTSSFFAYEMLYNTAILLNEAYMITSDGGMKGPTPWIVLRVLVIVIVVLILHDTTLGLAKITMKVKKNINNQNQRLK